jgi:hypothetical protein
MPAVTPNRLARVDRASVASAVTGLALVAFGTGLYLVSRSAGTSVLPPGLGIDPLPVLTGSLPSLSHTAGFGLLSAAAVGVSRRSLTWSAATWTALGCGFEALQHPIVAAALMPAPAQDLSGGLLELLVAALSRFAHLGTFDPLDLVATVLGGVLTLVVGRWALRADARR